MPPLQKMQGDVLMREEFIDAATQGDVERVNAMLRGGSVTRKIERSKRRFP